MNKPNPEDRGTQGGPTAGTNITGRPPEGKPPDERDGLTLHKLYKWGWKIISFAKVWFFLFIILTSIEVLLGNVIIKGVTSLPNLITGEKIEGVVEDALPDNLMLAALVLLVMGVIWILVTFISRYTKSKAGNSQQKGLQQQLHDKLLTLGPTYHKEHKLGETTIITNQYSTGARMILTGMYITPVLSVVGIVSAIYLVVEPLKSIDGLPSSLIALFVVILLAIPYGGWMIARWLKPFYLRVRESQVDLANEFTNSLMMPIEVQQMGAVRQRSRSYGKKLTKYFKDQLQAEVRSNISNQFQPWSERLLQLIFIFVGASLAVRGGEAEIKLAGIMVQQFFLIPQAVGPLMGLIQFYAGLKENEPSIGLVINVLESEPETKEKEGAVNFDASDELITFKDVTFSYVSDGPRILDGLSCTFEKGKVTAIVARVGGGKSTLLNIVARLWDPQEGTVYIGDKDIRDVSLKSLRRKVFKVSQFPLYIADTIRANMLLAKEDATDPEIEEVCRRTGFREVLVRAAPPGTKPLDYVLPSATSDGLSGGQRRLLSITRALLPKPSILLIDEPTTGIDAISVQDIVNVISMASEGRTVLLVDHNMDFIQRVADCVCCLEDGKFTDVGTPEELKQKPSLFKALLEAREDIRDERHPVEAGTSPHGEAGPSDIRQRGGMTSPGPGKMDLGVVAGKVPEVADVEGQAEKWLFMRCPHCGTMNMIQDESEALSIVRCWFCHFDFK